MEGGAAARPELGFPMGMGGIVFERIASWLEGTLEKEAEIT